MALRDEVEERYPSLIPLLQEPSIARLLGQAVKNNWSPGKFQSAFIASRWFRTRSASQRRWWILSVTDPGEAGRQRKLYSAQVGTLAASMGVGLNTRTLKQFTEQGLMGDIEPDSPYMKGLLVQHARKYVKGGHILPQGALRTTAKAVQNLAENGYLTTHSKAWYWKSMEDVVTGKRSMDDIETELREAAAKQRPHLAKELAQGRSVAEIVEPYRQMVADELELGDSSRVDIRSHPSWRMLLGIRDPKTNQMRLPTESEVLRLARRDDRWGDTARGKESQYSMIRGLMETMGNRKF